MQDFGTLQQPLLGELAMSRKRERRRRKKCHLLCQPMFLHAAQGSARTPLGPIIIVKADKLKKLVMSVAVYKCWKKLEDIDIRTTICYNQHCSANSYICGIMYLLIIYSYMRCNQLLCILKQNHKIFRLLCIAWKIGQSFVSAQFISYFKCQLIQVLSQKSGNS